LALRGKFGTTYSISAYHKEGRLAWICVLCYPADLFGSVVLTYKLVWIVVLSCMVVLGCSSMQTCFDFVALSRKHVWAVLQYHANLFGLWWLSCKLVWDLCDHAKLVWFIVLSYTMVWIYLCVHAHVFGISVLSCNTLWCVGVCCHAIVF
jgi:hypothetical protein